MGSEMCIRDREGTAYEEATYEGYGPGGVAVLVETMTDNRNRTTAEIRKIFSRAGGNLGEAGCVSWMFQRKGLIVFDKAQVSEDELMEVALEAGADDIQDSESVWEVICEPDQFEQVKQAFDEKGLKYTLAQIAMIPQTTVRLSGKEAEQMIRLMEALEEHDDVQNVYSNFDIAEEELERLSA